VAAEGQDEQAGAELPPDARILPDEQRRDDVEHLETELESDDALADPDDPENDPAMAPLEEAGEGVSEGFEGSEKLLEENAEGERDDDPLRNPFNSEPEESGGSDAVYGEPDQLPPEPDEDRN
jgi:hypothetical protein